MKHVKQKLENGEIIHFLHSINHSLCGTYLPDESEFTKHKVNCGTCIGVIDRVLKVDRKEYV